MKIKIKKLREDTIMPKYGHKGDAGMDMYALEDALVLPGEHHRFFHGFALEFPEGYVAIVKDKSSISKAGLHTMGGVFDSGFRGEYNTHLVNLSQKAYKVEKGDKISQLLVLPVVSVELEESGSLSDSKRGVGAFGSTGRK